jgi:cytochrome bd-type quinol oxidase subunit 2
MMPQVVDSLLDIRKASSKPIMALQLLLILLFCLFHSLLYVYRRYVHQYLPTG